MRSHKVILITGSSASGKTQLAEYFQRYKPEEYYRPIQCTTRHKREEEQDGVDYYFLTDSEMEHHVENKELIAQVEVEFLPYKYGTRLSELQNDKTNVIVASSEGLNHAIYSNNKTNPITVIIIKNVPETINRPGRNIKREDVLLQKQVKALKSLENKYINFVELEYEEYKTHWNNDDSM